MAMGAICGADELGLRVPQDISVIGNACVMPGTSPGADHYPSAEGMLR